MQKSGNHQTFNRTDGVALFLDDILAVQANKPPFLFMDEAFNVLSWVQAGSRFRFPERWDIFEVHFEQNPMVPATIMLEMMMQTAALAPLLNLSSRTKKRSSEKPLVFLTKVFQSRFSRKIMPGQEVITQSVITWKKEPFGKATAEILDPANDQFIAGSSFQFFLNTNSG